MADIEKPDRVAAHRRAETIRSGIEGFAASKAAIAEAFEAHDWITLGHTSWGDYCKKEIGNKLKLPRADRDLAIQAFHELGMSVREIADALEIAKSTVQDALKPPAPKASGSGHLGVPVTDPLAAIPAAEVAVNEFINNQADPETNTSDSDVSGSAAGADVADPPAPAAPQDHPVEIPGEAEDEGPEGGESSGVDDVGTSATQTELERSAPVDPSGLVDGRERPEVPGVSAPAALVPDDDEQRILDWRRGVSRDFMRALVDAHMRLQPDPLAWLETTYLPGSYPDRNMPRVRECFTPESIRITGKYLLMIADYLERNEIDL